MTDEFQSESYSFFVRWRLPLLIGIVLIVGAVVAVGLWSRPVNEPTPTTQPTNTNTNVGSTNTPVIQAAQDTDGDRLSDRDEAQFGTNASEADTDGDRLYDYEELRVWSTDPRNGDSDGDGVGDGDEVDRGMNPGGPGSFLNVNAAINNLEQQE